MRFQLLPSSHLQRVETPAANHLFNQLDARLRDQKVTLATLASPYSKAPGVRSVELFGLCGRWEAEMCGERNDLIFTLL